MTSPDPSPAVRPVEYKGEPLDAERGPGLGCFRFQLGLLVVLLVLTPLSVSWSWPWQVSAALLVILLLVLLFAGQTIIFLLRLVAADRREGRRRPLSSGSPTVGELEDSDAAPDPASDAAPGADPAPTTEPPTNDRPADPGVRE